MDYYDKIKDEIQKKLQDKENYIKSLEKTIANYEKKIEEFKHREEELKNVLIQEKETNMLLRGIMDSAVDGIQVVDNEGNILHTNHRLAEIFSISEEDILKYKNNNYVDNVDKYLLNPKEFEATMKEIIKKNTLHTDYIDLVNGKIFERIFCPLILDGNVSGRIWRFRDVTENIKLERELTKSENLYRKLINLLPDGIISYKNDDSIIANNSFYNLMKYDKDNEILNSFIKSLEFVHPHYREAVRERRFKIQNSETENGFMEQKFILKDGTVIDVEAASFSFNHEGDMYITSVIRDITERKNVEKLQKNIWDINRQMEESHKYNRLKSQLISTISHEFKTPVNIIYSAVQLLEKLHTIDLVCPHKQTLSTYLSSMKINCLRLVRLINNFIDINKIELGYFKLSLSNYDIVKVVEDITLSTVQYTDNEKIKLIFDTQIEECNMAFDAEKLERVILNLLSNAVKFNKENGEINVNMYVRENKMLISVKDTGIGIPENMIYKIFEPFEQVDASFRRMVEGNGIGLSLVKSIVEMHKGKIFVESKLGEGSEFIIELPITLLEEAHCSKESELFYYHEEKINIEFSDIHH